MAERYEVLGTTRAVSGGALPAFEAYCLGEPASVDAEAIAAGPHVAPLFVDDVGGRVVFAEVPTTVDLRDEAFAFFGQHRHAKRLIAVSYDELRVVTASYRTPQGLVFVFNTSRCGSTLLHRAFNRVPGVSSLGELGFVNDLRRMANDPARRDLVVRLIRDAFTIAAAAYGGMVAFKHLAFCTAIADLHHAAFPDAELLFLYRNAIDWAASWQRILGRDGEHDINMGMWLDAMDDYTRCTGAGTPMTAMRYEDLATHPKATLTALLDRLGWPIDAVDAALSVFNHDAQAGTDLARVDGRPNPYRLNDDQRREVEHQLREHAPSWPIDPTLPGTLAVSP
ncbi:MAG: sulfotransferase [Planctomycetota bacterium]